MKIYVVNEDMKRTKTLEELVEDVERLDLKESKECEVTISLGIDFFAFIIIIVDLALVD